MKGYKLDKTLYIFDAEPAAIPVSVDDVDIIYVQQELVEEFKSENPDNAAKIKPYNYKLMAVNKLPWADYIDNDLNEEHVEPVSYGVNMEFTQKVIEVIGDPYEEGNISFAEPALPIINSEPTHIHITLPADFWYAYSPGIADGNVVYNITYPETIQDMNITWPYLVEENPETGEHIYADGSIEFTQPENEKDIILTVGMKVNDAILPEVGTVYNFVGREDNSSQPTSTGTVTYNGIYEGTPATDLPTDGSYIWGTATVTFTGASEPTTVPVFISEDYINAISIYINDASDMPLLTVRQDDPTQTVEYGYAKFITGPILGTAYNFRRFENIDSEPSSTGTITFNKVYYDEGDGTSEIIFPTTGEYYYSGTATITLNGESEATDVTIFIDEPNYKEALWSLRPILTVKQDDPTQIVEYGYAEISQE